MSRYQISGGWSNDKQFGNFLTQCATVVDKQNRQRYSEGAFRVVRISDDKPAKTGKGGTVPFYGESAWSDAERLASDLALNERYGR